VNATYRDAVDQAGLPGHWTWRVEVRPGRRTLGFEVRPDGSFIVAVPAEADPGAVTNAVRSRTPWLARAIRRRTSLASDRPVKELVDSECFVLLGRGYRLLIDELAESVRLEGEWLHLPAAGGAEEIIAWYTRLAETWLLERIRAWAPRLGVPVPAVKIRDLGDRWGVRAANGTITVHWAAMQLPAELIDLIIVHELTHLSVAHHNADFRDQIQRVLPEAVRLDAALADVGRRIWLGDLRGR
jgi:predicted metal-dependent hydrolase